MAISPLSFVCGEDEKPRNLDLSKRRIEKPLEVSLTGPATLEMSIDTRDLDIRATDISKADIEAPTQQLLSSGRATKEVTENFTVKPGLVHWHPDFTSACDASGASAKPVLLFQLLGQLDQIFT